MYTHPIDLTKDEVRRFYTMVGVRDDLGCLPWEGRLVTDPKRGEYGVFTDDSGVKHLAHRVIWTVEKGPLLEGQLVLHSCNLDWCMDTNHMYVGDSTDVGAKRAGVGAPRAATHREPSGLAEDQVRRVQLTLGTYSARANGLKQEIARRMAVRLGVGLANVLRAWRYGV